MYKSNFKTKYISLYKDDFFELEKILLENISEEDKKPYFRIQINYVDNEVTGNSVKDLFEKITFINNDISISINDGNISYKKSIYIYFYEDSINVTIKGEAEIWVKGMAGMLKDYLNKKKTFNLKLNKVLRILFFIFPILITILLKLIFFSLDIYMVLIIYIALYAVVMFCNKYIEKLFPIIKTYLYNQEDKVIDKQLNWTKVGAIFGILSFVAMIMFGIYQIILKI